MTYLFLIYSLAVSIYAYAKYQQLEMVEHEKQRIIAAKNEEYSKLFAKFKELHPEEAVVQPMTSSPQQKMAS